MTSALDRLNLRPQERRLIVGIAFVLFAVLNIWFIWPHFNDWSQLQDRLNKARENLVQARKEIALTQGADGYDARLKKLEQSGPSIQAEEQSLQFQRTVDTIARTSGVTPTSVSAVTDSADTSTTSYFVEKSLTLGFVDTEEKTLVDFLYNLGSGSSMFRVKELTLKPYAGRFKLEGKVTIIASYLKNLQKSASPAPVAKPATFGTQPSKVPVTSRPALTNTPPPVVRTNPPPANRLTNAMTRLTRPGLTNTHTQKPPNTGAK